MPPANSPPALQEATKNSTAAWQLNLEALFHHAKDRFPDVVWELAPNEDDKDPKPEEVWGHKAIVYARAPPSFQTRYFQFRPNTSASPNPYSSSPTGTYPTTSALSLSVGLDVPGPSRTPSPFRSSSPAPTTTPGTLLRLNTSINSALFSNELEYLYTGQGFGEAFEFLFDSAENREEGDAEELRIDKLRKDLVFMWRSRLYSDVRIALTGGFSSSPAHENSTAIFSSHRFILVSRSPYFHNALISWPSQPKQSPNEPLTLTLPSPPFTPASLHFTLGFIYTGTLVFSHRTYDLDTAFHIMRSATYLSLQSLYDEIQARIVQEMMHGLFHAFLEFSEYERLTGGKWGTGGCRCRQCARRAPRVLEFAISDDVKNPHLDRGARRALVGLFGEGWCTPEFSMIPQKTRDSLLKGVGKRTTPLNVFALLFAAEHAMAKLSSVIDLWADVVRDMILSARKVVDDVICSQSEACFSQPDWLDLMDSDGVRFEDGEQLEWIMSSVLRGINEKNAPMLYQTLVSSILLRPHPTEANAPMLSSTSHIRVQVEQTRMDVVRWIGKHSLAIRLEGSFDDLEGWALKEISDHIEVSIEDLLMPAHKPHSSKTSLRASTAGLKSENDNDAVSLHSMRISVLNKNMPKRGNTPTHHREHVLSSAASTRSVARSAHSTVSRNSASTAGPSPPRRKVSDMSPTGPRPDSKLTPMSSGRTTPPNMSSELSNNRPSIVEPDDRADLDNTGGESNTTPSTPLPKTLVTRIVPSPSLSSLGSTRKSVASRTSVGSPPGPRPKSSASVRSHASTIRKSSAGTSAGAGSSSLRPSRPTSSISTNTEGGATFRTANSVISRSRRTSTASTTSNISVRTAGAGSTSTSTSPSRARKVSTGSTTSMNRSISGGSSTKRPPPLPGHDPNRLGPQNALSPRPSSTASLRSTTSTVSTNASAAKKVLVSIRKPESATSTPVKAGSAGKQKPANVAATTANARANGKSSGPPPPPSVEPEDEDASSSIYATPGTNAVPLADSSSPPPPPNATIKGKSRTTALATAGASGTDHRKTSSNASSGSVATLKRKGSSDTITRSISERSGSGVAASSGDAAVSVEQQEQQQQEQEQLLPPPQQRQQQQQQRQNVKPSTVGVPQISNNDNMTTAATTPLKDSTLPPVPRGATLEIGIPCIISSKRKRFKALARYIGEVEGESGPWVGVEVPLGRNDNSWFMSGGAGGVGGGGNRDKLDGGAGGPGEERQWHDGSWGGIRYFEIGSVGSEWEYSGGGGGDDRAARRRRTEWSHSGGGGVFGKGVGKREGDQLSVDRAKRVRSASPAVSDVSMAEARGLFVRPQQVLYVVDAVGSDLDI